MMADAPRIAPALAAALVAAAPVFAEPDAAALERLVRQDCGSCHGMTLKGGLGPALTPEALEGARPADLVSTILDGAPERAMPSWRPLLSEAEARWIADYLLTGARP